MRIVALGGFHKLVDDVLGRHTVRIAHAHVYNIFTTTACCRLQFPCDVEHIGGKALDAGKLGHDRQIGPAGKRNRLFIK